MAPFVRLLAGSADRTVGWAEWVFASAPVAYVAPLIALAVGGGMGAEDSLGLAGTLPSIGLSVRNQFRCVAVAVLVCALVVVVGAMSVAAIAIQPALPAAAADGRIIADTEVAIGFVVAVFVVALAVWMYAMIEYTVGRRVGAVGAVVAWLLGFNIASAFLPIGAEMFGPRTQTLAAHLGLGAVCVAVGVAVTVAGRRAER